MKLMTLLLAVTLSAQTQPIAANDSLNVTISGSGVPVVFIPGLLGSGYGFRGVISRLDSAGYRSIVIEPLGFGRSQRPEDADYSLTAQADRIAAVLDTLVSEPAYLVAHSVAASIAYRLSYRHPDLVAGILSLEGGPSETLVTSGFRAAMKFAPAIRMMGSRPVVVMIRKKMAKAAGDDEWITDELIAEYTAGFRQDFGASLNAFKAMSRSKEPELLAEHLDEIGCPVVLLLGSAPHESGPSEEEIIALTEGIAEFSVRSIPDAGHYLHEEDPASVTEAILELTSGSLAS